MPYVGLYGIVFHLSLLVLQIVKYVKIREREREQLRNVNSHSSSQIVVDIHQLSLCVATTSLINKI